MTMERRMLQWYGQVSRTYYDHIVRETFSREEAGGQNKGKWRNKKEQDVREMNLMKKNAYDRKE